jgi:delta14-sterol reductase
MTDLLARPGWESLGEAALVTAAFVALLFVLSRFLPGRRIAGARTGDEPPRTYIMNGLPAFVLVLALAIGGHAAGWFSLAALAHNALSYLFVANAFALAFALALYFAGRKRRRDASGALAGFWLGVARNPQLWGVDLKLFSYRPSLIGLALVNLSLAAAQLEEHGALSDSMILYQAFAFLYLFNHFQFEHGLVFTWDVIAERFGFMLVWGDYVLVPFFYALPGWYAIDRTEPLAWGEMACLVALFAFGLALCRGANEQKHRFKLDPRARIWGRPAETLGGRLLVSGFWGIGRHLNYTGEICVYLAVALTAGFRSAVPYLLPLWIIALLAHRAVRDERRCREKYGPLWDAYVKRARFRIVPYLY